MSKNRDKEFHQYSQSSQYRLLHLLNDETDGEREGDGGVKVTKGSYKFIQYQNVLLIIIENCKTVFNNDKK